MGIASLFINTKHTKILTSGVCLKFEVSEQDYLTASSISSNDLIFFICVCI